MAAKQSETPPALPQSDEAARTAREDAMLDLMTEMQSEIKDLKAQLGNQPSPATATKAEQLREEFDTEGEALAAEFADYPAISMVTRRMVDGVRASSDIRLKRDADVEDEDQRYWTLHWFNLGKENRAQEMTDRGWVKTHWDELQNVESIASAVQQDEYVRRGDRGLEVLGKMPRKLWDHLKRREAAAASGLLSSESRMRNHLANTTSVAAGKAGGNADQAGSLIAGTQFTVDIKELPRERVTG